MLGADQQAAASPRSSLAASATTSAYRRFIPAPGSILSSSSLKVCPRFFCIESNSSLRTTIDDIQGTSSTPSVPAASEAVSEHSEAVSEHSEAVSEHKEKGFREKFPATFRATDGHFVRSRSEMLIDNWLYMAEIVHAYERKLPVEEDVYCDFYIPSGKLYIEFWGMEADPKYADRMKVKRDVYAKYGFNLIELRDDDVHNLDDILPARLLKFGVQAY